MSKAELIIRKRINAYDTLMDGIIEYELQMEEEGIERNEPAYIDSEKRWHEYVCIKCELVSVLAEIKGVAIDELVY